jgi:hypothetical protein
MPASYSGDREEDELRDQSERKPGVDPPPALFVSIIRKEQPAKERSRISGQVIRRPR